MRLEDDFERFRVQTLEEQEALLEKVNRSLPGPLRSRAFAAGWWARRDDSVIWLRGRFVGRT